MGHVGHVARVGVDGLGELARVQMIVVVVVVGGGGVLDGR
jgi:hypothetical protein